MDAKQLIALCDEHPKAFGLIGARRSERSDGGLFNFDGMELPPWAEAETSIVHQWVKWLYGACVLEFVRRQWELPLMWRLNGVVSWHINDGHEISHQTPLLAMLAAIEAAEAGR